jgi:type IV secretory pathway TraG/TraD family ATPase VirD4
MLEILKDVALTIMSVGFGLAVLFPALLNLFITSGMMGFIKPTNWKESLSKYGIFALTVLATIAFGAYFTITLYYIWIA